MHDQKRSVKWCVTLVTLFGLVFLTPSAPGQTFQVIHKFLGGKGASPYAGLTIDAAGRLYGTTINGGTFNHGTVFRLIHSASGWVLTPLYNFAGAVMGPTLERESSSVLTEVSTARRPRGPKISAPLRQ